MLRLCDTSVINSSRKIIEIK